MKTIRRAALVAIFVGTLFAANMALAGEVSGKIVGAGLKSVENIAIYAVRTSAVPGKKFDPPAQHVSVDERNLKFVPHTTLILQGTTVDFLNSDQIAHNVYWPSISGNRKLRHSLTIVSPGQKKSFQFDIPGTVQLLCNLHPDMLGYVVVVPTPYFALTSHDGTFTIKNVPPGAYTLQTWSEDGKPTTQTITVTDAAMTVELTVKK